jgi:hypothetical protein
MGSDRDLRNLTSQSVDEIQKVPGRLDFVGRARRRELASDKPDSAAPFDRSIGVLNGTSPPRRQRQAVRPRSVRDWIHVGLLDQPIERIERRLSDVVAVRVEMDSVRVRPCGRCQDCEQIEAISERRRLDR